MDARLRGHGIGKTNTQGIADRVTMIVFCPARPLLPHNWAGEEGGDDTALEGVRTTSELYHSAWQRLDNFPELSLTRALMPGRDSV